MTALAEFEAPTWSEIYGLLLGVSEEIQRSGFEPEVIVGVCRGGWVPARVLSDLLDNANLANVRVECYTGISESRKQAKLTQPISTDVAGKRLLVVDEVADSGRSLKLVLRHLKTQGATEVKAAVLFVKPNSAFKPDYFGKQTARWVVFPWEIRETLEAIQETCKADPEQAEKRLAALEASGVPKRLITRFIKKSEAGTC